MCFSYFAKIRKTHSVGEIHLWLSMSATTGSGLPLPEHQPSPSTQELHQLRTTGAPHCASPSSTHTGTPEPPAPAKDVTTSSTCPVESLIPNHLQQPSSHTTNTRASQTWDPQKMHHWWRNNIDRPNTILPKSARHRLNHYRLPKPQFHPFSWRRKKPES